MCQTLDRVAVAQTHATRPTPPRHVWISSVTVWLHIPAPDCRGGATAPQTTTVHTEQAMVGCFARLLDGSTDRPPAYLAGVRPPVWFCPMMR